MRKIRAPDNKLAHTVALSEFLGAKFHSKCRVTVESLEFE